MQKPKPTTRSDPEHPDQLVIPQYLRVKSPSLTLAARDVACARRESSEDIPGVSSAKKLERYKQSNYGSVLIWDRDLHSQTSVANPLACYASGLMLYRRKLPLHCERIVTLFCKYIEVVERALRGHRSGAGNEHPICLSVPGPKATGCIAKASQVELRHIVM